MSSGQPLTDEDRWPWLRTIGDWMSQEIAAGRSGIVTCSALRRAYRDLLRRDGPRSSSAIWLRTRTWSRTGSAARQDHFMPPSLLHSQYDTLEPLEPDEPGVEVSVDGSAAEVIARAVAALQLQPEGDSS